MDEVLGALESEITALFVADNVVDCPVLEGGATEDRPDEYVSVVGMEAEYRAGNAYLVEMEFRSVVPLDDTGALQRQKLRFRQMVDYINASTSPLRTYSSPTLMIHGLVMSSISSKQGERSRAEIARVRFGATATGASPGSITFVVTDPREPGKSPAAVPDLKATLADAEAGADNTKWMTPLRVWDAIRKAATAAVTWANLPGKPSTFPPEAHHHTASQITDFAAAVAAVDAKFGPYASTAAALADISAALRYQGLTIGITTASGLVEYWFKAGVADSDFVEKTTGGVPTHQHEITEINGLRGGGNVATNTALGPQALVANTTGEKNTALGPSALAANTTGSSNTAIGPSALALSNGLYNTAIGQDAMAEHRTGTNNTAIGISTLLQFENGSFLTAIGSGALAYFKSGNANTAIGNAALLGLGASAKAHSNNTAVGDASQLKIDTGNGNSSFGAFSLINNTTGSQNTAVGNGALVDNVSYNNTSGLGYNAAVTGNNQVQLGNSSATTFAYGAVQDRSDLRDKADVRDTTLGLDFILALRPVDFRWDMREDYRPEPTYDHSGAPIPSKPLAEITRDGSKKRSRYHHGLIAQEVRELLQSQGIDFGGYQDHAVKGGDDVLSLGYIELIGPLIKAVQELSARIEKLEALYG